MEVRTERGDYSRELQRLATFANWSQDGSTGSSVCPLILARLGFRYTGQDDTVVCCHCQTEVRGWSAGDDVRRMHSSCLQQVDWSNEISSIVNAIHQHIPTTDINTNLSPPTVKSTRDVRDHIIRNTPDELTTSTVEKSHSPFYEVCKQTLSRASQKNFADIYSNAAVSAAAPVPADVIVDRTRPDLERLRVESARLATFFDWPERVASIVSPGDVAKAGLFYTGQTDRVQCAFCRGYLRNWVQGDIPAEEHRRLFPDCPFVRKADVGTLDVVDNTKLPSPYLITSNREAATAIPPTIPPTAPVPGRQSNQRPRPKHPDYTELQQRVMSFHGKRVPAGQSVDVLARAGLFYVGPLDNVRCFCCDGGLKHWQPNDDPWTEHKRWFPRCAYVIEHGDQLPNPDNITTTADRTVNSGAADTRDTTTSNVQYRVEPREIKARLDSPMFMAVIEMGYSRDLIRQVIERRLTTTGDDFASAADLVETIHKLQGERDQVTSIPDSRPVLPSSAASAVSEAALSQPLQNQRQLIPKDESLPTNAVSSTASAAGVPNADKVDKQQTNSEEVALEEENRKLKEARTCRVCMDKEINIVFLPCGHLSTCEMCSKSLSHCPICSNVIRGTVKTFLA